MTRTPIPNRILHGDCVQVMRDLPSESVDFILTDPLYLVRYRDRGCRAVANDDRADWLRPAVAEMHRALRPDTWPSASGWNRVDLSSTTGRRQAASTSMLRADCAGPRRTGPSAARLVTIRAEPARRVQNRRADPAWPSLAFDFFVVSLTPRVLR